MLSLVRQTVLDNLVGLVTGSLKDHFKVLHNANVEIYVSAIVCEIRGVTQKDLDINKCKKVLPKTLLKLSLESDRTFVY